MAWGFDAKHFEQKVVSARLGMERTEIVFQQLLIFSGGEFAQFNESPRRGRPKMNFQFSKVFGCRVGLSSY